MKSFSGVALNDLGNSAYLAKANSFVAILKGTNEVVVQLGTALVSNDDIDGLETLAKDLAARI